jgi:gamma-glutamyltranspeptidase/glutathione hydrolase
MMVINEHVNELIFAGAASGGAPAATSLIHVAARTLLGEQDLVAALEAKRVHHEGMPDTTFVESGLSEAAVNELRRRGHQVTVSPVLGRVNAAYCAEGLPSHPNTCTIAADPPPRGYGLAATGS